MLTAHISIRRSSLLLRHSVGIIKINNNNNNISKRSMSGWSKEEGGLSMVESWGDYREEEFLEDRKCAMYEHQSRMRRLTIPTIQETVEKLVPTCLPLASTKEEKEMFEQAIAKFPQQALTLQDKLQCHIDNHPNTSWLQHWWNTDGYLKVNDPTLINVSYFFHFSPTSQLMIPRAVDLLYESAHFSTSIVHQSMPQRTISKRQTPLCSVAYKYMFHACRIPQSTSKTGGDSYRLYNPYQNRHVLISCRGQFYSMPLFHDNHHQVLSKSILSQLLSHIYQQSSSSTENALELGWLTAQHRKDWGKVREELLKVGGDEMKQAFTTLESATLLLCLDDTEYPVTKTDCGNVFWTGNVTSTKNRWFDKSIQLFVTGNGQAGLMGEHSMMDGMPVLDLAHAITSNATTTTEEDDDDATPYTSQVHNVFQPVMEKLQSNTTIPQMIQKAKNDTVELIQNHDLQVCHYAGYGANEIKKMGYSPDAYVQMAMQLATYRLWDGQQGGTYEATQTRTFLHGRTETTRSVSPESAQFCHVMNHSSSSKEERRNCLKQAAQVHSTYTRNAANGKGVDRHLLGLSYMADDDTMPDLFQDPLYKKAKTWRVSTSHLTHPKFDNWGYGEVVPDGIGLAYSIQKDSCIFNITALKHHEWTHKLSSLLEEALMEMKSLHDDGTNPTNSRSKL